MATYPGGNDRVTVDAFLKMPQLIARPLTALAQKRFVADRIFSRGSAQQVASGAALFQRSESIYPNRGAEEVGLRSRYPRTGWSEELLMAAVHKYGLEIPIADEARRRNQVDTVQRAIIKLSNAVVKFVDTEAINLFIADPVVLTDTASGDWTTVGTDIIADIAGWKQAIIDTDEGYDPDIMLVNPAQYLDLMVDKDIRDALPREGGVSAVVTGSVVPLLGLTVISSPQVPAGTVITLASKIVGTIADEQPLPDEGYASRSPGPNPTGGDNLAPVYVKSYREEDADESIVRAARFPAMWIAEPKAAMVATGA